MNLACRRFRLHSEFSFLMFTSGDLYNSFALATDPKNIISSALLNERPTKRPNLHRSIHPPDLKQAVFPGRRASSVAVLVAGFASMQATPVAFLPVPARAQLHPTSRDRVVPCIVLHGYRFEH